MTCDTRGEEQPLPRINYAYELLKSGSYEKALDEFRAIKHSYACDWVNANIEICERRLARSESRRELPPSLDPVTDILLENAGEQSWSQMDREAKFRELEERWAKKSETIPVKSRSVRKPAHWPASLSLAPLPETPNDFAWMLGYEDDGEASREKDGISVIVPTFNRSTILSITLACLSNQETSAKYEVIVVDDGSHEQIEPIVRSFESRIDIKYLRQRDAGYQLSAARNLGIRAARYEFVAILDCDMAPGRGWLESYFSALHRSERWALIGPRAYVDTSGMTSRDFADDPQLIEALPPIRTNNSVAGASDGDVSVDWRLKVFRNTDCLRRAEYPFRYFSGGNVAFSKKWVERVGYFNEDFAAWGGEDNEYAYRLYRHGCFFKALWGAMAYHQEPPGAENETDREAGKRVTRPMVENRVPVFYRTRDPLITATVRERPLVSIYIPSYNAAGYLGEAIESALVQTVTDLEVVICDDGSTDRTYERVLKAYEANPRVRAIRQSNRGIGSASNCAVRACRGHYIGQLDADDLLLPDAVERCLERFDSKPNLGLVYTSNWNFDEESKEYRPGYNWPVFSREKLTVSMIVHHFRMFTARSWWLTGGFNTEIENAVDYDIYLKISEVAEAEHINMRSYIRRLHGANTSITKLEEQKRNHFRVINDSLARQGLSNWRVIDAKPEVGASRDYRFFYAGDD